MEEKKVIDHQEDFHYLPKSNDQTVWQTKAVVANVSQSIISMCDFLNVKHSFCK